MTVDEDNLMHPVRYARQHEREIGRLVLRRNDHAERPAADPRGTRPPGARVRLPGDDDEAAFGDEQSAAHRSLVVQDHLFHAASSRSLSTA
jgi:hypothetical protein